MLTKFDCLDAYFLYRRQKIFISNLTGGIEYFDTKMDFYEFGFEWLILFLTPIKSSKYIIDYETENLNGIPAVILPLNWFTNEPLYCELNATTRGADNNYYNLFSIAKEPTSICYLEKEIKTRAGGIAIAYTEIPNSTNIKVKNTFSYEFYKTVLFFVIRPYNIRGFYIYHTPNVTEVEILCQQEQINYTGKFKLDPSGETFIELKTIINEYTAEIAWNTILRFDKGEVYFIQALFESICGNTLIPYTPPKIVTLEKLGCKKIKNYYLINNMDKFKEKVISFDYKNIKKIIKIDNKNKKTCLKKNSNLKISNEYDKLIIFPKENVNINKIKIKIKNNLISNIIFAGYPATKELHNEANFLLELPTSINSYYIDASEDYAQKWTIAFTLFEDNIYDDGIEKIEIINRRAYDDLISDLFKICSQDGKQKNINFIYDNKQMTKRLIIQKDSFDYEQYLNIELNISSFLYFENLKFEKTVEDENFGFLFYTQELHLNNIFFDRFSYYTIVPYPNYSSMIIGCDLTSDIREQLPICYLSNKNENFSIKYRLEYNNKFRIYTNTFEIQTFLMYFF